MDTRFPPVRSLPSFGVCLTEFLGRLGCASYVGGSQFLKPSLKARKDFEAHR